MYQLTKRSKTYLKSLSLRLTACLILGSLLIAAMGIPMPTGLKKDRSVPFPCQDRACGCMSAADCKHGCCCFSESERRDWAKHRGLDVSTLVDEAVTSESIPSHPPVSAEVSCCARESSHGSCCCKSHHKEHAQSLAENIQKCEDSDIVLAWQARRCQGQGEWWMTLSFLPLPAVSICCLLDDQRSPLFETPILLPTSRFDEPDVPVAWLL